MTASLDPRLLLHRMEEAHRQTQRQLNMIDRQITRRMTALIPALGRKHPSYRRGKPSDPSAFLERYRARLAALTAERQPEIDALSRKLARQDQAIEALRQRLGIVRGERYDGIDGATRTIAKLRHESPLPMSQSAARTSTTREAVSSACREQCGSPRPSA